ncbi:MAG: RNA polymerase sigma factor [Verrucomicrobiales bacterium]|nr:RNA polymerase sigma factor [Verrucomicrobiales bacterium]
MNDTLVRSLESLHTDAFGWALHCCDGAHAEAADVLQNAYLKVLQEKVIFRDRSVLKTWWFGVIRLTAKEEQRRLRFRESLPGKLLQLCVFENETTSLELNSRLEFDESASQLRDCLAQLPARQAEVLHLVFYQDLSLSEAATIMGVSIGSARTHYDRAKSRLRTLLASTELTHER